jgi:hypothetical protein
MADVAGSSIALTPPTSAGAPSRCTACAARLAATSEEEQAVSMLTAGPCAGEGRERLQQQR